MGGSRSKESIMKHEKPSRRQEIGRISTGTKGPPGFHMEASGLWTKEGLSS